MSDGKDFYSKPWKDAVDDSCRKPSFMIFDLSKDDVLAVETDEHRYEFKIVDPLELEVMITSDDPKLKGPSKGYLQGSAFAIGSTMRGGWIIEGLHLVVTDETLLPNYPVVELAPTRRVSINGSQVIPKPQRTN